MMLLLGGGAEQLCHQRVHQQQEGRVQLRANKEQGQQWGNYNNDRNDKKGKWQLPN